MKSLSPNQLTADLTKHLFDGVELEATSNSQLTLYAGARVGASDGSHVFVTTSDLTFDITVSGLGGLDTGSEAPDTWYYAFLVWSSSGGTEGTLLSASMSSPVLPSGYDTWRLIGAVRNDSSQDFRGFRQSGKRVYYTVNYVIWATSVQGSQSINADLTDFAPVGTRWCLVQGYAQAISIGVVYFQSCAVSTTPNLVWAGFTPVNPGGYVRCRGSNWTYVNRRNHTVNLTRGGYQDHTQWVRGYEFGDL